MSRQAHSLPVSKLAVFTTSWIAARFVLWIRAGVWFDYGRSCPVLGEAFGASLGLGRSFRVLLLSPFVLRISGV